MATSNRPVAASDERHMHLLMRLLDASRPLTSDEIFATVEGYRAERGEDAPTRSTLEKRFERDRKSLAEFGIIVDSVPDPIAPDDRARWRFALSRDESAARTIELTAEETLLVDQATSIWAASDVAGLARRAYLKLLATGDSGVSAARSMPSTAISTDPAFTALHEAIANRRQVEFDYVNAGAESALRRHVVPLRLVVVDGRWLCNAHDLKRDAERNYLVSRIVGEVADAGERTDSLVARTDLPRVLAELAASQPARLAVRIGTDAETRLRQRASSILVDPVASESSGEWLELEVPSWDHELLADDLAALSTQVRVLAPDSLAAAVRRRLERMLHAHREQPEQAQPGREETAHG
ncbi:WYL domain-containing protein [Gulosibacter macacae]|uniref:WYL domain-containing protein n=1 Tax=Gulosibacter macacae TaxID=2488791 RepID=A0A3P3VWU6_9MICO|nr:WYL domain-containing protein [Gulosibacter macacae]RRJ87170.1 WYL domain-containing protein [Gulosibacter macacae]